MDAIDEQINKIYDYHQGVKIVTLDISKQLIASGDE